MMDTQRWKQLRHLFDTAVELPQHRWNDYLRSASGDTALCREVVDMLQMDLHLRTREAHIDRVSAAAVAMAAQVASTPVDPRVGCVVGSWRILRELGQGSGGIVYLAESIDAEVREHVALKLPHPDAVASVRERFRTECEVLQQLRYPGIVRLIEARIEMEADPYLVFEYVNGRDVRRHCIMHELGKLARLKLFVQVCDIVAQVHASGIAHRDLRPQNILVARDRGIVLLDFGRAAWFTASNGVAGGEPWHGTVSEDAHRSMIAKDVRALARLLAALWQWPESDVALQPAAADESMLTALVDRALRSGHDTLAGLVGELRVALQSGELSDGTAYRH